MCRVVIAGGESLHSSEAAYTSGEDGSLGTATDDYISLAQTDEVEGISQSVCAGCTCRAGDVVGAVESVHYGDVSGADVGNHLRHEERAETRTDGLGCLGIVGDFLLEGMHTSDANAIDNTDTVLVNSLHVQLAVRKGFTCCCDSILAIEVHLASLLAVYACSLCIEILDFASELSLELRSVKMGDRAGTTYAFNEILPSFLGRISQRRNGTKACYNNSFKFHVKWG